MKKLLFYLLILYPAVASAQLQLQVSLRNSCSYLDAPISGELYRFQSSNDASDIVKKICALDGVDLTFEVVVSNVPNAVAIVDNGTRYIVYSEDFLQKLKNKTNTNWAAVSILAHEVGHHLYQHLLGKTNGRSHEELEADKFSGFILRKMGASLDDAQVAVNALCPNDATNYYPSKSARLEAIAVGWKSAGENGGNDNNETNASTAYSIFSATLPRDLFAKEGSSHNFYYTGSGSIKINTSQQRIEVSGNIDFIEEYPSGSRDIIKGNFSGLYYPTPIKLTREHFPLTLEIPLTGRYIYGMENHPVWQRTHSFKSLKITINDINNIEAKIVFSDDDFTLNDSSIVYK